MGGQRIQQVDTRFDFLGTQTAITSALFQPRHEKLTKRRHEINQSSEIVTLAGGSKPAIDWARAGTPMDL
jgi:hypothetical protein